MSRYCDSCGFLRIEGYEYPESYCYLGIQDDDPKSFEDKNGVGCRYNIRTLRKIEQLHEEAEYLRYIGTYDYSLMPTMEYTDESEQILEHYRELIRHALGMDNRRTYIRHGKKFYKPYRNYFDTSEYTPDYPYWEKLVSAGLAEKKIKDKGILYFVTRTGMDWLGCHDGIHIYDESK